MRLQVWVLYIRRNGSVSKTTFGTITTSNLKIRRNRQGWLLILRSFTISDWLWQLLSFLIGYYSLSMCQLISGTKSWNSSRNGVYFLRLYVPFQVCCWIHQATDINSTKSRNTTSSNHGNGSLSSFSYASSWNSSSLHSFGSYFGATCPQVKRDSLYNYLVSF